MAARDERLFTRDMVTTGAIRLLVLTKSFSYIRALDFTNLATKMSYNCNTEKWGIKFEIYDVCYSAWASMT